MGILTSALPSSQGLVRWIFRRSHILSSLVNFLMAETHRRGQHIAQAFIWMFISTQARTFADNLYSETWPLLSVWICQCGGPVVFLARIHFFKEVKLKDPCKMIWTEIPENLKMFFTRILQWSHPNLTWQTALFFFWQLVLWTLSKSFNSIFVELTLCLFTFIAHQF